MVVYMDTKRIERYIRTLKEELNINYNIPEEDLDKLLETFYTLVDEAPEVAFYQSPLDWARHYARDREAYLN